MNIVVEGPDASGKSTLARLISSRMGLTYISSGGPEKYPGEMEKRVTGFLQLDRMVFDRHPCISQPIYGRFRAGQWIPTEEYISQFYSTRPLVIYCYGVAGPEEMKELDTPEHRRLVEGNDREIRQLYSEWAEQYANIHCNRETPREYVLKACQEVCGGK